jgi:hypothetical protein
MSDTTSTTSIGSQPGEQELGPPISPEYPPSSDESNTPPSSPSLEAMKQSSAEESNDAASKTITNTYQPRVGVEERYRFPEPSEMQNATSPSVVGTILSCLQEVHLQMHCLKEYIEDQNNSGKPLYQWQKYGSYWKLGEAVSNLQKATAEFKTAPLYSRDFIAVLIRRTTLCSTSVSQAAVDILSTINKKTGDYMEEMEGSSLSDEAKVEANAVITQETKKLLEYSTRAAEHVWRATDLLMGCKQKREDWDWLWSTTATAMHVFIAAAVGIFTVSLFSPTTSVRSNAVSSQVLDVVQQTQAITNLTGEIFNVKLQDIDQRVNDLGALSEAHSLRIDNLVDGLGVPNEHGVWYVSKSQSGSNDKSCEAHLQDVSETLGRQLERQQQELEMLRKNMNRMDIRLTQDVKKLEKK